MEKIKVKWEEKSFSMYSGSESEFKTGVIVSFNGYDAIVLCTDRKFYVVNVSDLENIQ